MELLYTKLRERLAETLTPVFSRIPTFISDSSSVIEWLKTAGFNAFEFREDSNIPTSYLENVVAISLNNEAIPSYTKWDTLLQKSRVLLIPLVSFDPSMEAAVYTMELLAQSTFEAAAHSNEKWLKLLLEGENPLIFRGEGCEFACEVGDDVSVMRPLTKVQLELGEWDSVGAYFEVGMVPQPEDLRPSFTVNGTLSVPGVAVAHHRQMPENLIPMATRAWKLLQELRHQRLFPLQLHIENSRVIHVFAGEKDIAKDLLELTNKRREMVLTEMAISTNEGIVPKNIDWTKNAQLNEGAVGIHVGLGDGLTGAHIDFICPGVALQNS